MAASADCHSGFVVFGSASAGAVARNIDAVVGTVAGSAGGSSIIAGEAGITAGNGHAGSNDRSLLNKASVALACTESVEEAGCGAGEAGGGGG